MSIQQMREAASALLEASDPASRRRLAMAQDDPAFRSWTYLPGDRPGLCTEDMDDAQRAHVKALVRAAHGVLGAELVVGAIEVERVRRRLASGARPTGDRYWVRVHGRPDTDDRWGWRLNGHHVAVHAEIDGDRATLTPHFVGAEPAEVRHGPHTGRRLLSAEEDLARTLAQSLSREQRGAGVWSADPPDDILTRADPVADPTALPDGLAYPRMTRSQRELVDRLVRRYLDRAPADYARTIWDEALDEPDRLTFGWAGSLLRGRPHYYCVRSPGFLIEYDNTQDGGNHAHSVWRVLRDDFGGDPLSLHYARSRAHSGRGG
jgi:hypothetical protein